MSTSKALRTTFRQLRGVPTLPRSSHTLTVVKNAAYIFGGEIKPREPVDNAIHEITLPDQPSHDASYQRIEAQAEELGGEVPMARVGHAAAAIGSRIYVFGGRGGVEMAALEEKGRVWAFDTTTLKWSYVDPNPSSTIPPTRSYHAAASFNDPLPGTFFVHAGCLSSGGRASDLWAFDIASRTWTELPSAPGPARGGTALAAVKNRLYRFGGFDGKHELGGMDYIDLTPEAGGRLRPSNQGWQTQTVNIPNRSVAGMVPVSTGYGDHSLIIVSGEHDPSTQGHAGAGRFLDDIWNYENHDSGAYVTNIGKMQQESEDDDSAIKAQLTTMSARGWFAADRVGDGTALVWGGINEANERLGDGWIIAAQ
jgi:hypothetical protein